MISVDMDGGGPVGWACRERNPRIVACAGDGSRGFHAALQCGKTLKRATRGGEAARRRSLIDRREPGAPDHVRVEPRALDERALADDVLLVAKLARHLEELRLEAD